MVAHLHNIVVLHSTVHRHFTVACTLIFTVPKFLIIIIIIIIIIISNYTLISVFCLLSPCFVDRHAHTVSWFVK